MENKKKKAKGVLPNSTWRRSNGYGGLSGCILKYPYLFKHIDKENKRGKTIKEWIKIAKKLIKKNNGFIPDSTTLREMGYSMLSFYIKQYPELFSFAKQKRRTKTIEKSVKIAEKKEKQKERKIQTNLIVITLAK